MTDKVDTMIKYEGKLKLQINVFFNKQRELWAIQEQFIKFVVEL